MQHIKRYLDKNQIFNSKFGKITNKPIDIIVIIPAYKESNISETLNALLLCECHNLNIEVLIYINGKTNDNADTKSENEQSYDNLLKYIQDVNKSNLNILCFKKLDNDSKTHGVGKARKFLMDEAVFRFYEQRNTDGIIVNLDADSTVDSNYFIEIFNFFRRFPDTGAVSIFFEHRLGENTSAIIDYELHLRYFIGMQKQLNLPYAFQTIGSSMAVSAEAYVKVGGMNTRQAGEDFYFLHKFSKLGILKELNSTTVCPSGRISDRVPFGTGKAIMQYQGNRNFTTYNFKAFETFGALMSVLPFLYEDKDQYFPPLDSNISTFLNAIGFESKLEEIKNNVASYPSFEKRFYQNFGAFFLMKFLHSMRESGYPDEPLEEALPKYFRMLGIEYSKNSLENLIKLRQHDKSNVRQV